MDNDQTSQVCWFHQQKLIWGGEIKLKNNLKKKMVVLKYRPKVEKYCNRALSYLDIVGVSSILEV